MLLKITRGLGTRHDTHVLMATIVIGLGALVLGVFTVKKMLAPKGVVAVELPREEALALGGKARGPMPEVVYVPNDLAKVASYAAAQRVDGTWGGVAEGTVLQIMSIKVAEGDTWVTGMVQGGVRHEQLTLHASFLERYLPLVLERAMEVSDVRLLMRKGESRPGIAVSGWLRNVTGNSVSQCVVACVFQDKAEREVTTQRTEPLVLEPMKLVRFQTGMTDKPFASIALQISHATPDGLRNYLSTVVIQRSNLQ